MLPPNDKIEGIRLADTFAGMVGELEWNGLKAYLLANSQLSKLCQLGGYRLEPKHRKRFESLLVKEAEKSEYSQSFCNPIFAQWYPIHQTLYKALEDYFHSDAYKTFRQERSLGDDAYVLSDEMFQSFFKVEDLEKWRVLLCFSPLQFTKEQGEQIVKNAGGNDVLLRRVKELEEMLDGTRQEKTRLEGELERVRSQASAGGDELQELRKARRDLTGERNDLQNKFEASQTENRKLRQALAQRDEEVQATTSATAARFDQEKTRLAGSLDKLEKELNDWRTRYEQQRAESRDLKDRLTQTENELAQERTRLQARDRAVADLQNFADLVLKRIDWLQTGKSLRLTPELQKQFNSVMKKLHYESGAPSLDTTMVEFWAPLIAAEKELVDRISQSNTLEVSSAGGAANFWESLKDPFEDVVIGIEARLMLLKLLREIFFQTLGAEDLEAPKLPAFLLKK